MLTAYLHTSPLTYALQDAPSSSHQVKPARTTIEGYEGDREASKIHRLIHQAQDRFLWYGH